MPIGIIMNGVLVLLAVVAQVVGASLMPATRGFTQPGFTAGCLAAYVVGVFAMARLIANGVNLSIVVPIMTCTVPLAILAVAIFYLGEPAPVMRIVLLLIATVMIGVASTIS